MSIRVIVADDHTVVRHGIVDILKRHVPDIEIVGQAVDGQEAITLYEQEQPDLLLLDLRMPQVDGLEVITHIITGHPQARIIVMTTFDSHEDIYRSLQNGAKAYLLKDASKEMLLECIQTVMRDEQYIPLPIAMKLARRITEKELSEREIEILHYVANGNSNRQIAAHLYITEGTVKTHLNRILSKLDAQDRTEAVVIALRRGILHLD